MPKRSYREEIMNDLDNMLKFLIIYDEENTEQVPRSARYVRAVIVNEIFK